MDHSSQFPDYYAVIMAGGGGTRLWPVSRQDTPKQAISLIGAESLFQIAVNRLDGLFPAERILVVTTEAQAGMLHSQCPELPAENFLLEPEPKGTASVVGLAAAVLSQRDPNAVIAMLTADHFIADVDKFHHLLRAAYQAARQQQLVTLGINPAYPATGYGYIQSGKQVGVFDGLPVLQALRFKEKPDSEQASQMLESGDHTWNSGMFIWQAADILEELDRQMPELYARLQRVIQAWPSSQRNQVLQQTWAVLKNVTIDYGIMENARRVVVIPAAGLGWNDVGSWESLFDVLPHDSQGNIATGSHSITIDTNDTLIFSTQPGHLVVTIGVSDLVVVDTGDVVLVCHKYQAQKVRQAVSRIKTDFPEFQ